MSRKILIDAIGNIDDTYIEEYAHYKAPRGKQWIPYEVLAACAVLVLAIGIWVWRTTGPVSGPEGPEQPDGIQAMRVSESAKPTASEEAQPTDDVQVQPIDSTENAEEEAQTPTEGTEEQEMDISADAGDGADDSTIVEGSASESKDENSKGQQGVDKPADTTTSDYNPSDTTTDFSTNSPPTEEPAEIRWNVITACNDPYEEWQNMLRPTQEPTEPPTMEPGWDGIHADGTVSGEPGGGIVCSPSSDIYDNGIMIDDSVQEELGCSKTQTKDYLTSGETVIKRLWYGPYRDNIYDYQVFTPCGSIEEANSKYPMSAFSNVIEISNVHGTTVYLAKDSEGRVYARFLKQSILVTLWGKMSDDDMLKIIDSLTK